MAKSGPETKLVAKMRKAGAEAYGTRLVSLKYHGGTYSATGVSDILVCLDSVFGACEVKAPESYGGSIERALAEGPTAKQLEFGRHVNEAGGLFCVAATVEQYMEFLWNLASYVEYQEFNTGARYL